MSDSPVRLAGMTDASVPLSRTDASAAVEATGWRYVLGAYLASAPVPSLRVATALLAGLVDEAGDAADEHLRVDLRPDRVELAVQTRSAAHVTRVDADLAARLGNVVRFQGLELAAATGPGRPVQTFECAIDALDILAIRPFWKAVLGYVDEVDAPDVDHAALVDPAGQGPAVWFQQMDAPRTQRNRIHFDIAVAHDEAQRRVQAAGGVLVSDADARSFWILADVEGNEICVCTWQDRDPG